tara:strand:- start:149 stop:1282 length:1134 start_codon:yes stop_codon:yes gene_type:complete
MIYLKGMTWDHSRGFDPMVATSKKFQEIHNNQVSIVWDKRPLQAFADRPIEEMTEDYDLIVIDYPHVGEVASKGLLQNLDLPKYENQILELKDQSVGKSHESYFINNKQWALAIDAASQTACYREDLIASYPLNWNALIGLAQNNKVLWPLKPVHAISSFYSIYNNLTEELIPEHKDFIKKDFGVKALEMMKSVSSELIKDCFTMDPIQTAELMTETNDFYYCPYIYGFSNYSRKNYRKNILKYINVMDLSGKGPSGTHLGGTGIAVSNESKNKDFALEYAFWIAGASCQKSLFYESGGQPGNSEAWENQKINQETNDFFRATRKTLDLAWVRPRHNGYMEFQDKSGDIINEYLQSEISAESVCEKLSDMYNASFKE